MITILNISKVYLSIFKSLILIFKITKHSFIKKIYIYIILLYFLSQIKLNFFKFF